VDIVPYGRSGEGNIGQKAVDIVPYGRSGEGNLPCLYPESTAESSSSREAVP
jgi:hypothetical protein